MRIYSPLSAVDESLFCELAHIGKVLGVHGFTNTSCIQSNGRRFYFEVDIRPNVWVDFPKYFGEDPAERIQQWFSQKNKLSYPVPALPNQPSQILLPYFMRLKWFELLFNRYNVWAYMPKNNRKLIVGLLMRYMVSFRAKHFVIVTIKRIIPVKYHNKIRRLKKKLFLSL